MKKGRTDESRTALSAMERMMKWLVAVSLTVASVWVGAAPIDLIETRYCGSPNRTESGKIVRNQGVLREFQRIHPCPSTGKKTGVCPGWAKDHVIPLACGGCDSVGNLQWLPKDIKSSANPHAKDRFERKIYCDPVQTVK